VNHAVQRCWVWVSVTPSCCHVGDGATGGGVLAHVVRRDSNPATAGQMAHPLTRRAERHCCGYGMLGGTIRCLPRRRFQCSVSARSASHLSLPAQAVRNTTHTESLCLCQLYTSYYTILAYYGIDLPRSLPGGCYA
jgi:hypothetical protein